MPLPVNLRVETDCDEMMNAKNNNTREDDNDDAEENSGSFVPVRRGQPRKEYSQNCTVETIVKKG